MPFLAMIATIATSSPTPAADWVNVPPATPEAIRYYQSGIVLWIVTQVLMLGVPAAIAFSGLSAWLWARVRAVVPNSYVATGLFGVLYVFLEGAILFPLLYYSGFVRPRQYERSQQSFLLWFADEMKALGVTATIAFLVLGLPILAIRRHPRSWPIAVTMGYLPLAFAMAFLALLA